ncbi:DUF4832 domain-containing protein [Adhaeretor mobilis]|uniref:DUF4832 domain-containing protein n=1 Tax=Adhaeretor mobilis TaxID=1930276 RepID=UPI001C54E0FE|nr:DUF4832 domain-containing protein [Adhaeretor mobilis]
MHHLLSRTLIAFTLLTGIGFTSSLASAAEPPLQTITFQSSNADILNPERGFFKFSDLTNPWFYQDVRSGGETLVYGRILADQFRNSPFSQSFLDDIQSGFDAARSAGIKVKPRVAYNDNGGADAPKSVILNHIQQLQPLWESNKDVIYHMDAGFIGGWGEWHSSTNGLDNAADRTEILTAILDALPEDRMVGIRTPHFKRQIFNGSAASTTNTITEANAFDGSDLSRVGHLNDCFLASSSDFGTYVTPGFTRQDELDYIGAESKYAPHGGETCADSAFSTGVNAVNEMEQLHTDYLNIDYNTNVLNSWKNDGNTADGYSDSYQQISQRLGYRFELQTAALPDEVKPSGLLQIEFEIDNVGFGELFNPREVEITLENNSSGEIVSAPLQIDPRFWSGGTSNDVQAVLSIPADMAEGTYTVGIKMPDLEDSLDDDVRYSIRFANQNVWDATTGINVLKTDLQISQSADGTSYQVGDSFEEVVDPNSLLLAGDFDADGKVDGADFLRWQLGMGSTFQLSDLADWQANFGVASTPPSTLQAVPEPHGVCLGVVGYLLSLIALRQR